jgi:hypothetical protein
MARWKHWKDGKMARWQDGKDGKDGNIGKNTTTKKQLVNTTSAGESFTTSTTKMYPQQTRTVHKWATGWGWQRTVIQVSVRNNNRVLNGCRCQCIRINNASTGQFVVVHGTGFAHGETGTRRSGTSGTGDTCREFG